VDRRLTTLALVVFTFTTVLLGVALDAGAERAAPVVRGGEPQFYDYDGVTASERRENLSRRDATSDQGVLRLLSRTDALTQQYDERPHLPRASARPVGHRLAPRGAIGFAPGEGASALTAGRLQHGTRHLTDMGVLPAWSGSKSPQIIRESLGSVLERPTSTFDHVLRGGTRVEGFLGEVNGQRVAVFVFKEGPYQGQLASSVVPSPSQLAKWGVP
jgi:hypothetical protein